MLLGIFLFTLVQIHFAFAFLYVIGHMAAVATAYHRKVIDFKLKKVLIPALFIWPQLLIGLYGLLTLDAAVLDPEIYQTELKMGLIKLGILIVEYPMLALYFGYDRYQRY